MNILKKKTFFLICIFTIHIFWVGYIHAEGAEDKNKKKKSPIHITSQNMISLNKGKKIIFTGDVVARHDKMTIFSDKLEVYNNEDKSKIYKIVAIDNVRIENNGRHAKGDKATYLEEKKTIEILGNATAWEGENIIHGKKIVYNMTNDTVKVTGNVDLIFYSDGNSKDDKKAPPNRNNDKEMH